MEGRCAHDSSCGGKAERIGGQRQTFAKQGDRVKARQLHAVSRGSSTCLSGLLEGGLFLVGSSPPKLSQAGPDFSLS